MRRVWYVISAAAQGFARNPTMSVASTLTAKPIVIAAHAGEEGKLFGSVTPADVAEAIERQVGVSVDRHDVHIAEAIRSVGAHEVRVHLFADVDPVVTVEVEGSEE